MTAPTLSPAQPVRRWSRLPAIVANPGRFCRACGVERSQLDRALHHERGGRCEDCAERGIPPMPLTGRLAGRPGEDPATSAPQHRAGAAAVRHSHLRPAPDVEPSPLSQNVALYLKLRLDHISPHERAVGLHAASTLRRSRASLREVIQTAARVWYPDYADMTAAAKGQANTHTLRILRNVDRLAA